VSDQTDIGVRELTQELGESFTRRGWDDPESFAFEIAQAARRTGVLDPKAATALASKVFLERNRIGSAELEGLITEVFAGRNLVSSERDHPPVVEQHTNTIAIRGDNNSVANINAGGRQTILTAGTAKERVLEAVRSLVREGSDHLDANELADLDRLVSSRSDLDLIEVEAAARAGLEEAKPDAGRLQKMREAVVSSTASGLLVQAIIAVIGVLL
jgi:hypothetical protein